MTRPTHERERPTRSDPARERDRPVQDSVALDDAFLDISDGENEAMTDARNTFDIALISVVVFVAIVFVFVL